MNKGGKIKVEVIDSTNYMDQDSWSEDSVKSADLKQILKPMLYTLAMAGNYTFSDINSTGKSSTSALSKLYRLCIFVILLLFFAKAVASIFHLSTETVLFRLNLMSMFWTALTLCTFIISFKSTTSKFGYYEKAFQFWNKKILLEFQELDIEYPVAKMKRGVIIATILTFSATIMNIVGIGVQLVTVEDLRSFYTIPFECKPLTLTVAVILIFFVGFAYHTPAIFAIIFSIILREAFNSFNDRVSKICEEQESEVPKALKKLRLLHLHLCKLVNDLDQDLGWFYGVFLFFKTGLCLFTLYQMIRSSLTTFDLVMYLFWLFSAGVYLGVSSICAARVHESAHAPLDHIYYLNVQDITVEKLAQLNMFLSKLTGTQIGFSTCGFLIITKEFILTIAGVFLTYFVVLYTL